MTRSMLRHIRVASKKERERRIYGAIMPETRA
jgi:hypothetical protein